MSLTEAGEAYLGRVRQILQDIDEADAQASAHTEQLAGRLRVHTLPVLATYVIAPMLSTFRQRYPGIIIDIAVEAYRDPPIEDFDLVLLGVNAAFDANIVARKVVESDVILVRVLHPWLTGRLAMYAALPSRKFIPQRTQVFLDYLIEHTREQNRKALDACVDC